MEATKRKFKVGDKVWIAYTDGSGHEKYEIIALAEDDTYCAEDEGGVRYFVHESVCERAPK